MLVQEKESISQSKKDKKTKFIKWEVYQLPFFNFAVWDISH